jgi:hypothetical protein
MISLSIAKRFVLPFGTPYPADSSGFLLNSKWLSGPEPMPIEELSNDRFVVLLGDTGIGKSTELKALYENESSALHQGKRNYIWLNMGICSSETLLYRKLFDDPAYKAAIESSHPLTIFLDALDESQIRIDSIAAILASEFPALSTADLRIRVACRSSAWCESFARAIGSAYIIPPMPPMLHDVIPKLP